MWPGSQQNLAERLYINSPDDPEAFLAAFNSKQILSKRGVPGSVTALFNSPVAAASHCFPDPAVYGITLRTSWNKKMFSTLFSTTLGPAVFLALLQTLGAGALEMQ